MPEYDIVIRGGTVVDGLGGEPYVADVAIREGLIAAVGRVQASGAEEIDATGKVVTPGFVDVHTHYDGQITWENRLAPSSGHGVTTVVMGNCGVGFAPVRPADREILVKLMEGVEDIPDVVMTEGVPFNWETFPEYLDALDQRKSDIDFAAQLPHSPLRVYVMGERGANHEPPTEQDLTEMRRLTTEAIKAGALGVTTSHTLAHSFKSGKLAPSVPTKSPELLALAAGLRDANDGVFQMVPDFTIPASERLDLLRAVAREGGRPVSFTFMHQSTDVDGEPEWRWMLRNMEAAQKEGLEIRGQMIPRPVGMLLGLELSYHPFSLNPSYKEIADLPLAEKVARMQDPEFRKRLIAEEPEDPQPFYRQVVSEIESLYVLGDPPNYHPDKSESIAARARTMGVDPRELIYDSLLARDGHEVLYRPAGNDDGERFEAAGRNLLGNEYAIPALGDGGAHYSLICDAAYTTYILSYWHQHADADRKVELPILVRKMTSEPARTVGLNDRGVLKPGYKADVNVIDLENLRLYAPHATYDLPTGGRRLSQKADGYDATIVSGVVTYRHGKATGELPGRLVRGSRGEPGEQVAAAA